MLTGIRSLARGVALATVGITWASSAAFAQPAIPRESEQQVKLAPSAFVNDVYLGRWVTELPNGARMVQLKWLRKSTRTLENGVVETRVTPLARQSLGVTVPSRVGGGTVIVATHTSGGGGGGGGGLSFGGSSSGGGGGGGGGTAGFAGDGEQSGSAEPIGRAPQAPSGLPPSQSIHSSTNSTSAGQGQPSSGVVSTGPTTTAGQKDPPSSPGPAPQPPAPQYGPVRGGSGPTSPSSKSTTSSPTIGDSVPFSIHVDGREGAMVVVPEDLFDGQWTVNLTTAEIGGGGITLRGRGRYPTGSLAEFDLADYLEVLDGAVRLHVPEDATGFATLDYESGLLPWAERTREIYKEGMTDEAFEIAVHEFFVESLRTAKAARPNVRWSFYGYPHWWERPALSERIIDIYTESDAITPSHYIRNSGDPESIKAHAERLGKSVAAVQDLHPLGEDLPVALYVSHRYSSVDKHNKAFHSVTTEDFFAATSAAEPFADQFVMWMAASTPAEANLLSEALAEGGRIRELIYTSRGAK